MSDTAAAFFSGVWVLYTIVATIGWIAAADSAAKLRRRLLELSSK